MKLSPRPTLCVLCGPSGAGKSSLSRRLRAINTELVYLSTDALIEEHARSCGKTYGEIFADYSPTARARYHYLLSTALRGHDDVLIDRTHTTVDSRRKVLDMVPGEFDRVAICVGHDLSFDDLLARRDVRRGAGGFSVPASVILRMFQDWAEQRPKLTEGFDLITYVNKEDIL